MKKPIRVLVFARAPRPGQVKTRLIPALGEVGAALLYEEMLAHALATAWAADLGEVEVWLASRDAHRYLAEVTDEQPLRMAVQCVGDIGQRMAHALSSALADDVLPILIGSDLPPLSVDHLQQAAAALGEGCDAVVAPTTDGGYGLIGVARELPELFADVPWSTGAVMARTRELAERAGLRLVEIDPLWDVDEPADLERLTMAPYAELLASLRGCGA